MEKLKFSKFCNQTLLTHITSFYLNNIFRILHDHGFSEEEMLKQKSVVFNNTVQAMVYLLRGMNQLNIQFDNPSLEVSFGAETRHLFDIKCQRVPTTLCR